MSLSAISTISTISTVDGCVPFVHDEQRTNFTKPRKSVTFAEHDVFFEPLVSSKSLEASTASKSLEASIASKSSDLTESQNFSLIDSLDSIEKIFKEISLVKEDLQKLDLAQCDCVIVHIDTSESWENHWANNAEGLRSFRESWGWETNTFCYVQTVCTRCSKHSKKCALLDRLLQNLKFF
jgi:hypothetical protein